MRAHKGSCNTGRAWDNETCNIASVVEVSDLQIFEEVRRISRALHAAKRLGETDRVSLGSSRAKAALGWETKVALREGIQLAVEWHH